jgi:hypothetical protein
VVPLAAYELAGHAPLLPLQDSAGSHVECVEARHTVPAAKMRHVPFVVAPAATEHASHAPALHEELQQTPSVQKPLWHWEAVLHAAPFAR